MPSMSEKDVSSCPLVEEAEMIILEHQRNRRDRSHATEIFGGLLDAKKAGVSLDAEDMRALELRDQCVEIIRSIKSLLGEPISVEEKSRKGKDEVKALGMRLGFLVDAGILLYNYENKDPEMLLRSPVRVAEYASSMLATVIDEHLFSKNNNFTNHREGWLSLVKHVDRFIGEGMGTMTEKIPNH